MRILKENSLGLVVDIQEKLLPHVYENQKLLENIGKLIEGLKLLEIPVIFTEQYRKGLGATTSEISKIIEPFNYIEKMTFSCCDNIEFEKVLITANKKYIVIAGIEAHVCVMQTVVDLLAKKYCPVVVSDCISSRKIYDKQVAVERMRDEGAIITTIESILFELCRCAGTEQFKAISKLVK